MKDSNIYSIWKPSGITSFDVIREIKSCHKNIKKIGHCGTLDPFAEGILIICTGSKVKESQKYMNLEKTYIADILFGSETDTLDCTGVVIRKSSTSLNIDESLLQVSLTKYLHNYMQSPPYYSAKKINGVKMYEFARKDIFIKPKGSLVKIQSLKIINYVESTLKLEIKCGAGTYIRSLARDIAYDFNTFGYVNKLTRSHIGNHCIENSIKFRDINKC